MQRGSAGFTVTAEMEAILRHPGYISCDAGGQRLRDLYQSQSAAFDYNLYNPFARCCFLGLIRNVSRMVERGEAPDLTGTETPYKFGYLTIAVTGCVMNMTPPPVCDYVSVVKCLLSSGAPPNSEDIVGYSALHHAAMNNGHRDNPILLELMRILLKNGANANHQNRYGEVPISGAFQHEEIGAIDILMEYGADLEMADADGVKPNPFFIKCGAKVTAAVTKWLRKRTGEEAPMGDTKMCSRCGRKGGSLKMCAKCHVARYCSTECQHAHWSTHKLTCQPFDASNTVTVRPSYSAPGTMMSTADFSRQALGIPTEPTPASHQRAARAPKLRPEEAKAMIIKVQVPYSVLADSPSTISRADMLVYTKKRDFVCNIKHSGNAAAYSRISQVVRSRGVGGAKAYFPAELKGKYELIIKIGEVLAEQPF
ncbi:ankyrin [Sparassis crispa]|uniref:Ankyrin n=1 Tax=Sparassis crispa TaxID=139825 RepID=A0A401GYQ3_9APHY|nr:ankyrin [Sparassis crispa]GBE87297.1 ankyrin [Sparassis crispa]